METNRIKKFSLNKLSYILIAVLMVAFAILTVFGMGNSSAPSTFYATGELKVDSGYNAICYKINYEEDYVLDSIWINFSNKDYTAEKQGFNFYTHLATSDSKDFTEISNVAFDNNFNGLKIGQWQQIANSDQIASYSSRKYLQIAVKFDTKIGINEIVAVGKNGTKLMVLSLEGIACGAKLNNSLRTSISDCGELQRNSEAVSFANKLIDEQNKFNVKNIDGSLYKTDARSLMNTIELENVAGIKNLVRCTGYTVSTDGPLGSFILSIGTSIFGYTPLGIRIIPAIFSVLSIYVVFMLIGLVFKNKLYSVLGALIYSVVLYGLGFSITGSAGAILALTLAVATYFALRFFKFGGYGRKTETTVDILTSGGLFAISFAVMPQAIYFLPMFVCLITFGFIRQYKLYKARVLVKTTNEEFISLKKSFTKNYIATNVILAVLSFILFTFILELAMVLLGYSSFSTVYNSTSLLKCTFAQISNGLVNSPLPTTFFGSTVISGGLTTFIKILCYSLVAVINLLIIGYSVFNFKRKNKKTVK